MNMPARSNITEVQETSTQRLLEPNIIISAPKISTVVTTLAPQISLSNLHSSAKNSTKESEQNESELLPSIIIVQIFGISGCLFFSNFVEFLVCIIFAMNEEKLIGPYFSHLYPYFQVMLVSVVSLIQK